MAKKLESKKQTNGFDPERIRGFVSEIKQEFDKLASEKGAFMERCKVIRTAIDDVYKSAKAQGVLKAPLKAVVKTLKLERDLKDIRDDLDDIDYRNQYDLIRDALGDFASSPLGQAASTPPQSEAVAVGAIVAKNVERLRGIKEVANNN